MRFEVDNKQGSRAVLSHRKLGSDIDVSVQVNVGYRVFRLELFKNQVPKRFMQQIEMPKSTQQKGRMLKLGQRKMKGLWLRAVCS